MSGLTRSQIESWDPSQLLTLAGSWRTMGTSIESLFDRYVTSVTRVNEGIWEGTTAEATQNRATGDRRTAITVVDALESLASTAEQGFYATDPHVQAAKLAINGAENALFKVNENLVLTDTFVGPPSDERKRALDDWQLAIENAAMAAYNADLSTETSLRGLRSGLIATFIDAAALSKEQGESDGKRIADQPGNLSPQELERLKEAGSLTPEQIAALQAGDTAAIPASQMEYINALSRSLDGKSPQEIRDLMNKMPPEARTAFANALQIGSNSHVTASVSGDRDVPTNGGLAVLPKQIGASLTRDDLVVKGAKTGTGYPGSNPAGPKLILNGVADNQAIAEIAVAADDAYQSGSDLDAKLLDAGAVYLHAQVQAEQAVGTPLEVDGQIIDPGKPITESIFSAVAADKIAVAGAVTDPEHGMQLVNDIQTHEWSDNGSAVSSLFRFGADDFEVGDPNNAVDVATSTRTADIMEAVARASSTNDAWKLVSAIPGTDGQSVGELNPELLQTLSRSMTPYITDMAGSGAHPDFNIDWADDGTGKFVGAANVFALMNTDESAGELFDGAALNQQVRLEQGYGNDPDAPNSGSKLIGAGRIAGLIDQGTYQAAKDEYGNEAAQEAYQRKEKAFNVATNLLDMGFGHLPVGSDEASAALAIGGDSLKNAMLGPAPTNGVDTDAPEPLGPRLNANYWNVLDAAGKLDPSVVGKHEWAVDDDGYILSRAEMEQRRPSMEVDEALSDLFNNLNNSEDDSIFRNAYSNVVDYRRDDK